MKSVNEWWLKFFLWGAICGLACKVYLENRVEFARLLSSNYLW